MANNEKQNFYKRNEKTILSFLVVALVLLNIIFMSGLGKTNKSMGDVDTVEVADTAVADTLPETKGQHEVTYKLRNIFKGDEHNDLVAYIDGKFYETGIQTSVPIDANDEYGGSRYIIEIKKVIDLDNDGYDEAILVVEENYGGGNIATSTLDIVYYDSQSELFKRVQTKAYGNIYGNELELEQWQGLWSIIVRDNSLKFKRYIFQSGKCLMVEGVEKKLSTTKSASYSFESMFSDADSIGPGVDRSIAFDLNGDGYEDIIDITDFESPTRMNSYDGSFTLSGIYLGRKADENIESEALVYDWLTDREIVINNYPFYKQNLKINSWGFSILSSKTKGMYDLMTDNGDVYQWDGKKYNLVHWNGERNKIVKR